MPRVARRKDAGTANLPLRSPNSIPLNDDQHEKAARFQSRQALHELQLNQIRAAASPGHRKANHEQVGKENSGPVADGQLRAIDSSESWAGMNASGLSNLKRVPILANFEEWMKMATDNKINATNSWNFALIDYFHDMSLLKEGDSVNFQKASCTLDGCVKIYTSRVDSVATETGKLLSGLADSGNKTQHLGQDEEGDDDEENETEGSKKGRKRTTRSSEATLVASFTQIQLKKFELEFAVDPLFKKASADFDEGGAKGLLLNHLCIDVDGRIIFDSSDDTLEATTTSQEETNQGEYSLSQDLDHGSHFSQLADDTEDDIDITSLQQDFFPDLMVLDSQDICPSLKTLDIGETLDLASLPLLQDHRKDDRQNSGIEPEENEAGFLALGSNDIDLELDPEFGAGGEVWAQEAGLEPLYGSAYDSFDPLHVNESHEEDEVNGESEGGFGVKMQFGRKDVGHTDILGYFDTTLKSNWAGPEHWRIKRMKQETTPRDGPKRKERIAFEIDFHSPLQQKVSEQIYTSANSSSAISLPKSQWRSRTRHLLPDDKHFNSNHLLRLFLKPRARLGRRGYRPQNKTSSPDTAEPRHIEDTYWAEAKKPEALVGSDYDTEFFREDDTSFPLGITDDDVDEFSDARERFSPPFEQDEQMVTLSTLGAHIDETSETGFGTSLVTKSRRLRPEYVSYAKVAKKVDVRLLKEKMWQRMGFEDSILDTQKSVADQRLYDQKEEHPSFNFISVMNNLQDAYSPEAMAEISTSYCFISLLHLANEKGLTLSGDKSLEDLSIRLDCSASVALTS